MDKKYTIGLDLGTSAVKAVLFDGEKVVTSASGKFEYKACALKDGAKYTGFDADQFASVVFGVIKTLSDAAGGDIYGLAFASASGNTLLCDKSGKPIMCAYSWTNPPFTEEVEKFFSPSDCKRISSESGWRFSDTFPVAHISHLKVHAPELLEKADIITMTTEYLLYKLTGRWESDFSTSTPFYLVNQEKRAYNGWILEKLGISESKLPVLKNTGDIIGITNGDNEQSTGLKAGVKVFLGSFDHPSGARANGITKKGDLLLSCGTSWVGFFPFDDRKFLTENGFLCDPYLSESGLWGAMFSFAQVSDKIDYLLKKYVSTDDNRAHVMDMLAEEVPEDSGMLKINPATDWDKDYGGYDKKYICRGILEGLAEMVKEKLQELSEKGILFNRIVMSGGPSKSAIQRSILEKTLGIKVSVKYGVNSGAVGAAILARGKE